MEVVEYNKQASTHSTVEYLEVVERCHQHHGESPNSSCSLGLAEDRCQHEGEHDDGEAERHHKGQQDPVVGLGGVEDDEVDEDAAQEGGARDEGGVYKEPREPEYRVAKTNLV